MTSNITTINRESDLQKKITADLKIVSSIVFNIHGHGSQRPGIPDLYIAHTKWNGWIELKVGTRGKTSEAQRKLINSLYVRGVNVFVARWIREKDHRPDIHTFEPPALVMEPPDVVAGQVEQHTAQRWRAYGAKAGCPFSGGDLIRDIVDYSRILNAHRPIH